MSDHPQPARDTENHPEAAGFQETLETEEQLVQTAQEALSNCRWTVGECASKWTQRYARGRTDADFGLLVGLSADQVYQRRRVWDAFADVCDQFPGLRWSHFYAATNWDDAAECLQWAEETGSTVAEMKAWRRAMRGEDLTTPADDDDELIGPIGYLSAEPSFVQHPDDFPGSDGTSRSRSGEEAAATVAGFARGTDQDSYAPFKQGATKPPASADGGPDVIDQEVSPEQTAKRLAGALERCIRVITPEFTANFYQLSGKTQDRLSEAARELSTLLKELQ